MQEARRPPATCGDLARHRRRAPQFSSAYSRVLRNVLDSNSFLTGRRPQQYAPDLTRSICHFARPRCFCGASRTAYNSTGSPRQVFAGGSSVDFSYYPGAGVCLSCRIIPLVFVYFSNFLPWTSLRVGLRTCFAPNRKSKSESS